MLGVQGGQKKKKKLEERRVSTTKSEMVARRPLVLLKCDGAYLSSCLCLARHHDIPCMINMNRYVRHDKYRSGGLSHLMKGHQRTNMRMVGLDFLSFGLPIIQPDS